MPIKEDVDENRIPGRYILTGSANPLIVPKFGDALAGRMLLYDLYPLSQGEIIGKKEKFLEDVFFKDFAYKQVSFSKKELIEKIAMGGFPEMQKYNIDLERKEWVDSYLSLALQKDIQDLAKIEGFGQLPNLLINLANRVGSLLNYSDISNGCSIPTTTLRRYIQLLHNLFLIKTLPAWSKNLNNRQTKAQKVYFIDTAILTQLLEFNIERLEIETAVLGGIVENFVILELFKQASWSQKRVKVFYFRNNSKNEVDIVLEDEMGKIVGIEIKSSETVRYDDFKNFKFLKEEAGSSFLRGVVLYAGDQTLSFGEDMIAAPIARLWS